MKVKEFLKKSNNGFDIVNFAKRVFEKAKEIDREYNAFVNLNQGFVKDAKKLKRKEGGRLYGLPITLKDAIVTKNLETTAGSKILKGYRPPFDATIVKKLRQEGALILGKTAQDEFGFGSFSVNCAYGVPRNPLDKERSCGGSSGGASCITKAADFPHIAIGESTGGSISEPAAFTGVYGLTPTYGRVSRYGLITYSNSFDKLGPLGKSAYGCGLALDVIAGYDPKDQTSAKTEKKDYTSFENIKGKKIGVVREYMEKARPEIRKSIWKSIKKLESQGAEYEEVSLKTVDYHLPCYYLITTSEASTNLAKYCGMRYGLQEEVKGSFRDYFSRIRSRGFGEEAKRRIMLGTYARMAGYKEKYYLKALKVRTKIIKDFKRVLEGKDILVGPTVPRVAPRFDEIEEMKPLEHYRMDILTVGPNIAGLPMLSVPAGKVKGMPVGAHLIGDYLQEKKILDFGAALGG